MPYLISNVPNFKCWVRREFTCNHMRYHGEFLHAMVFAVNTIPDTDNEIADDPAQHKQSHVVCLTDAGPWTGNIVALPNNRVRATSPALWRTGEGAPDFTPSQWTHSAESHDSYLDPSVTFNNLYSEDE